ncbi:hypothetical protein pipiens_005971 [Culex pipiens pipiens]|uniref:FLYWCH-type domain-containing protein n=1 Tax=Culex pipiens pipiens TaxID=38569 RepID=A0ABD1DSH6_CULPP
MTVNSKPCTKIYHRGFTYCRSKQNKNVTYWLCDKYKQTKCRARITVFDEQGVFRVTNPNHNHDALNVIKYDWGPLEALRFVKRSCSGSDKVVTKIYLHGFTYRRSKQTKNRSYWVCDRSKEDGCRARITVFDDTRVYKVTNQTHNHDARVTIHIIYDLTRDEFHEFDMEQHDVQISSVVGQRGKTKLLIEGHTYIVNKKSNGRLYWGCSKAVTFRCRARLITDAVNIYDVNFKNLNHNHKPGKKARLSGVLNLHEWTFTPGQRGKPKLVIENNSFFRTKGDAHRSYWSCSAYKSKKCKCKLVTHRNSYTIKYTHRSHSHMDEFSDMSKINRIQADVNEFYEKPTPGEPNVPKKETNKGKPKLLVQDYAYVRDKGNSLVTYWSSSRKQKKGGNSKTHLPYEGKDVMFTPSNRGRPKLILKHYSFKRDKGDSTKTYWTCDKFSKFKCRCRAITYKSGQITVNEYEHNHPPDMKYNKGKPKLLLDGYPYLRNNGNALKTYWIYFHLRLLAEQLKQSWSRCQFRPRIVMGRKGRPALMLAGYCFTRNNSNLNKTYWLCAKSRSLKCRARIITIDDTGGMILKNQQHNHPPVGPEEQFSDLKYSFVMSSVPSITYITGQRGAPKIVYGDYSYVCAKHIKNRKYWICSKQRSRGCKARLITDSDDKLFITRNLDHNHTPDPTYSRKLYKRV